MINSNLKQSGDRYYPITWIHRTIDPSTERCLSPSVWSKWSMRGFQGIWALNASWPELQWRGPLLPVELKASDFFIKSMNHIKVRETQNSSICQRSSRFEKNELEQNTLNLWGIPRLKKNEPFESSNPPTTNQSTTMYSSKKKIAHLDTYFALICLDVGTEFVHFQLPELHPSSLATVETVTIHPPPWLTSNVQHKGPVQKTIWDPHQAIKFGWKNIANIVSCVNLLLRLVSKVAEACQLQAVKQLHRTGIARIPKK